jgi:NADPH:quinone reductase-like Zn-dependent oxidoreductase
VTNEASKFLRALNTGAITACAVVASLVLSGATSAIAATPREQQAIVQHGIGGPEVLKFERAPVPEPGNNEVLIRVYAAAINPVDWKRRIGKGDYAPEAGALPTAIPGGDVAGIVEKIGGSVTAFRVGDPVFAVIPRDPKRLNGGYAQFAVATTATVVTKPRNVTFAEAAGLGVAAVTAVRSVAVTNVTKGQRVLVTGASGGVGSIAVQVAKARGAYVIGTASGRRAEYLRSIGVDEMIDYTKGKFEDQIKDVDVVIDTVGEDTALRAFKTMKKGGHYISVAARNLEAHCAAAGVTCPARANAQAMERNFYEEVGKLAAAGRLSLYIDKTFPLEQAGAAQSYSEQGRTQGKISLIVDSQHANRK